jgi:hypothetical protein
MIKSFIDPTAYHSGDSPSFAAVTGTSFVIGANTLTTSEWAFLDGQDQSVLKAGSPQFVDLTLTGLLKLPATGPATTPTAGVIYQNNVRVFHTYYPTNVATIERNVFIGENAGNFSLTNDAGDSGKGTSNVGIGKGALTALTTGQQNFGLGLNAGSKITSGVGNTLVGTSAGTAILTTSYNIFVGGNSGFNKTGSNNIAIGAYAFGGGTAALSNCIAIGAAAGYRGLTSNVFIVDSLISGRADEAAEIAGAMLYGTGLGTGTQTLRTNANFGIGKTPTVPLDVTGAILGSTTIESTTGFKCGGTAAAADGIYITGLKLTPVTGTDGSITIKGGIVTAITAAT